MVLFLLSACNSGLDLPPAASSRRPKVSAYEPVYLSREDLRVSVLVEQPKEMLKTGKIHIQGSYLFINEPYEGIHVIDNSNPSSPQKKGFLRIPGNVDMAVRGNILYADNAVDLVALDISNPDRARQVKRLENLLPENNLSPDGFYVPAPNPGFHIVGWRKIKQ